jgi:hypothetical protein
MEERALGDAGGFHNLVQTPSLKAVSVELGERGHEYPLPHRLCSLSLGLNHENKIQTSRYVSQALNLKNFPANKLWPWRFLFWLAEIKDPVDVGLEQSLEYLHQHLFKRKHCEA